MKWLLWILSFAQISLFGEIKLAVFVITSDHFPVYLELQKMWQLYSEKAPEQVSIYFLRADPDLATTHRIESDVIWAKTSEGWSPDSAGIINKTVLSMEALLLQSPDFDYVLRTNLSSFYHFPRLLKTLEILPRTRCYYGSSTNGDADAVGSGCGFIMSRDLALMLVEHKQELLDRKQPQDDQIVGKFFFSHNIPLLQHSRLDLLSLDDWYSYQDKIPPDIFHFRIKVVDRWAPPLPGNNEYRVMDDIYIHRKLHELFSCSETTF
jgi:hypothetical protein